MKNHLKRLAIPRTWTINRKENTFTVRPSPGPHSFELSLPLGVILRDFVKYARTIREAKKILNHNEVLVDGKRKKDHRLPVGLFDVLSFADIKKDFRILLDQKGRLVVKEISASEAKLKPCRIIGKKMLSKKLQVNLHDGKNILADDKFKGKVGDTVLVTLPENKIKELLELKKDSFVYVIYGKRSGDSGLLKEVQENNAVYLRDNQEIKTLKRYLFVLGDKKSKIDIKND